MVEDQRIRSKQHPELEHFASRVDARKAVHEWKKRLIRMPRFWFGVLLYTCAVGGAVAAITFWLGRRVHIPPIMWAGLVGGITGVSGFVAINWFWRHHLQRHLRQQLVARGIPVCLKCGYDLRGQSVPRCPECGTPFNAELIAEPRSPTDC
jgi:uncharacterized paraquat-inducible protein A